MKLKYNSNNKDNVSNKTKNNVEGTRIWLTKWHHEVIIHRKKKNYHTKITNRKIRKFEIKKDK